MRSKKAIKNIILSLLQQGVSIICGLILPRAIIGEYGSNVNGLISSITQFLSYITLLEAGIGPVIKSLLYKPIINKDKETIEKILKSAQSFFNIIAYIFILYIILLCFIYPSLVDEQFSKGYTISLIIIISISTFAEYFLGMVYKLYLQADQKTYITSNIQIITTILNTSLSIILIKFGANIQTVKIFSAFVFVLRPIIQNMYVRKKYNISLKKVSKNYELKQKWDGLAQHIASIIHDNTDVVVLTVFTNTIEVSVYTVYLFVIKGIKNLIQAFNSGIDASFGSMYANNEQEHLNKSFKIYELFYFTIITIIFTCTLSLILPFVQVYTAGITDANYYRPIFAYIIVIAEYMWAIRLPYNSIILSVGRFKETQKGAWVEAISNILISLLLVPAYGINGVSIGTLIAMTIRTIELMYHSSKYILKRNQKYSYIHLFITILETVIITIIINSIIKNVQFDSYIIWLQYSIVAVIISSIIIIAINSIMYKNETIELLKLIKKNIKGEK